LAARHVARGGSRMSAVPGAVARLESQPVAARARTILGPFRRVELIAIGYFAAVAAALTISSAGTAAQRIGAWAIPGLVATAVVLQNRFSRGWNRVLRDWATLGLILIAYQEVDWRPHGPLVRAWQSVWIGWDHSLLRGGLATAIESVGGLIPASLELAYLSLYGIPALCLGALYWNRRRIHVDRFLSTLFLGTLCAYSLLPVFPSIGPRVAFPGQDLPRYSSVFRSVNLWLLDHCDIAVSVFPSGHVAVAFSAAFGVLRAIPDRRRFCAGIFALAFFVLAATIYGRYHYAVDGFASVLIATSCWAGLEAFDRNV
jgi:membrane-associated phospholipid phosphatase